MPKEWEQVGFCAVDAGCLLLIDPCYAWQSTEPERYEAEVCDDWQDTKQLAFPAGHAGMGVLISTGLGDGSYPVEVRYEDVEGFGRRVAEVRIRFLSEDN